VVTLGARVRLKDLQSGDEVEYQVVGSAEADPFNNRISNESPVGQAIMGKRPGTIVEVKAPAGVLKYQILEVTR